MVTVRLLYMTACCSNRMETAWILQWKCGANVNLASGVGIQYLPFIGVNIPGLSSSLDCSITRASRCSSVEDKLGKHRYDFSWLILIFIQDLLFLRLLPKRSQLQIAMQLLFNSGNCLGHNLVTRLSLVFSCCFLRAT